MRSASMAFAAREKPRNGAFVYAIFEDGGKQYKVTEGDALLLERKPDMAADTKQLTFDKVLLIGGGDKPRIGAPYVSGASVTVDVLGEMKTKKVIGMKHRRRKGFKKKWGHRQTVLKVRITGIAG